MCRRYNISHFNLKKKENKRKIRDLRKVQKFPKNLYLQEKHIRVIKEMQMKKKGFF